MTAWETKKLLDTVEAQQGVTAAERLRGPLRSVGVRLWAVGYHFRESERVLEEVIPSTDWWMAVKAITGASLRDTGDYKEALAAAEAHVNAAAASLHTLGDIMAKVIWEAINLDPLLGPEIPLRKRYLATVIQKMKAKNIASSVTTIASALLLEPRWKQLCAFVNCSKHNSLIDMTHTVELIKKAKHGLKIIPYDVWPSEWSTDFLIATHRVVEDHVVALGKEINNHLGVAV